MEALLAKLLTGGSIFGAVALVSWWGAKKAVGVFTAAGEAYAKRKSEHLATKEDFDQLLDQLRKNTEATEQIRTGIAHQDWSAREWKASRARKLEEFLTALNDCYEWLEATRRSIMRGEEINLWQQHPAPRAQALQAIYFPELDMLFAIFTKKGAAALDKLFEIESGQLRLVEKGCSQVECLELMNAEYAAQLVLMKATRNELFRLLDAVPNVLCRIYGELPVQSVIRPEDIDKASYGAS